MLRSSLHSEPVESTYQRPQLDDVSKDQRSKKIIHAQDTSAAPNIKYHFIFEKVLVLIDCVSIRSGAHFILEHLLMNALNEENILSACLSEGGQSGHKYHGDYSCKFVSPDHIPARQEATC